MSFPSTASYKMQRVGVWEGNSITEKSSTVDPRWAEVVQADASYSGLGAYFNFALSGRWTFNVIDNLPLTTGRVKWSTYADGGAFFLFIGHNDLRGGEVASTIIANLNTIWSMVRGYGYKIITLTVTPDATANAQQTTYWNQVNAHIRNAAGNQTEHVFDAAALLPDPNSPVYYLDGLHLTTAGQFLLGTEVASAFPFANIFF